MTVTDSPEVALAVSRSGGRCVLIAARLPSGCGPGVALLVGDPADTSVQAAALAMEEELFGPAT